MPRPARRAAFLAALSALTLSSMAGLFAEAGEAAEQRAPTRSGPAVLYALIHTPGPEWDPDVPGMRQPGIGQHVGYMAGFQEQGRLVLGGPFLDDSGGMMILRAGSLEEARRIAREDPAVSSGLLRVEVKPWMVPLGDRAAQERETGPPQTQPTEQGEQP